MHAFVDYILWIFGQLWYVGIFVMMTIESSFLPFPSEVAMIPAGALAQKWEMNIFFALFVWTMGAWLGATINYIIGYFFGSKIIKWTIAKFGKYIFLKQEHYQYAEKFFKKNGWKTTFFGRFIPAVRQLISLPAGVFKMNFVIFSLFTILGAGIWNIFLLMIGYFASDKQDIILHYAKEIAIIGLVLLILLFIFKYFRNKKSK